MTGILGALRSNDTVARLGGDEFVVIAEDLTEDEDLVTLVDRLREASAGRCGSAATRSGWRPRSGSRSTG